MKPLRWIWDNRQWLFSGVAVVAILGIINFCTSRRPAVTDLTARPAPVSSEISIPVPIQSSTSTSLVATSAPPSTPTPVVIRIKPSKMIAEIAAARPLQRDDVAKAFVGLSVDWNLYFIDGRNSQQEYFLLMFSESPDGPVVADGDVLRSEYPELLLMDKGTLLRVRGVIEHVTESLIVLKRVSISQ